MQARASSSCLVRATRAWARPCGPSSGRRRFSVALRCSSSLQSAGQQQQQQQDDFAVDKQPVILFDGVCNLCNGGVNIVLDWDRTAQFRLAALQSPAGRRLLSRCGREPGDISSIVLVEERGCYVRSEAVRRIGLRLGAPFPLLAALAGPFPLPARDFLYDQVAANRYNLFGRSDACRLGDAGAFAGRFIAD